MSAIFVVAIIPLLIFTVIANANLKASTNSNSEERLLNEVDILKKNVNNQFDSYEHDIFSLMYVNLIQNFVNERANDSSADAYYNDLSNSDKINGSIYPQIYHNNSHYNELLSYLEKIIQNRPDIDLMRVFYKDGNILCGVSQTGEDVQDYKGDKSWFSDMIIKQTKNPGDIYISPISIARQTNTPAIRYITPYDVNGTRSALFMINFKASVITEIINNFKIGNTGFSLFLDLNYENAEGTELGPMFIANKLQPDLAFNESMANKIQFKANDFPSDKNLINFKINGENYKGSYAKIERDGRSYVIILGWSVNEINQPVNTFLNQSMVIFFILIVAGLLVSLLVTYILVKPLYNITDTAEKIKKGDYTARVEKKYKGEVGILADSFNEVTELITEKLFKASTKVKLVADQLSNSITDLASSSEEINASSQEISSIAHNLALGAQNQTNQLGNSVKQTNDLKSVFSAKIEEIRYTSKIIETITSQVNMLALNASIEAARAGEYGRGFAVVAGNIRNLADDTRSSLDKVNEIFFDLEKSLQESIDSLSDGIESTLSIAEETASSSEEASAATEEQSATIEEFTATTQDLSTLAHELNELTKQLTSQ